MRRYFSSFFGWCTDEELIANNPMRRIKAIKIKKIIKEPFSEMEMEKIRKSAENTRDRALVEFLYSTGCRVSEVVNIDLNDVDFVHNSIVVTGKGNKQREVYLSDRAEFWLENYLKERTDNETALFIGKGVKRLCKPGIEAMIKKIGIAAGVENVHPHRFRRTLATNLLNKGMPIQEVQQILGHTKLDTTMIYCKVDKNNVQAAHRKYAA
jgi:site-specific recombinase XerD